MGKGFGKVLPSSKSKKRTKAPRIKTYAFAFYSSDGVRNVVRIEAASRKQASERFNCFVETLESCLAADGVELERLIDRHLIGEVVS